MKDLRFFFLIVIIFKFSGLLAQYSVNGNIKDSTGTPIAFATVLMFSDDSLYSGSITNNEGAFELENIEKGEYLIEISYTGFTKNSINCNVNSNYNLGNIVLKEDPKILGEITVYGEKTNTSIKVDRLVYEISPSDIKNSKDSYQVLKNVPELYVNTIDKKVSIEGGENSLILINNIKRDPEALLSLNPKDILKVEVITNPSAKYLSRDVTGVINIITREKISGYMGEISESITPDINTNNWTEYDFTYKKNKVGFYSYGFFSYLNEDQHHVNLTSKTLVNESVISKEKESDLSVFNINSSDITNGIEINFNENNFMLIDARIGGWKSIENENYSGIYSINEIKQHDFKIENPNESYEYKQKYTFYFQSLLDTTGKTLAIEGNHNIFTDNYFNKYSEISPTGTFINNMQSESTKKSYDLQADYSQVLRNLNFEGGYRIYYQDVSQNLTYISENDSMETLDYKEFKNYLYLNIRGTFFKNFSYHSGFGSEYTNTFISNLVADTADIGYFKVLPTFGLQYKIDKKQNLRFNYSTKLNRPSISSLNPSKRYTDSLTIRTGNPYLNPYYMHRFELKYSYSYGKVYISPVLRYVYIPGYITLFGSTNSDGVYTSTYDNLAKYKYLNPAMSINYKIIKDWKIKAYVYYQYTNYIDNIHEINTDLSSYGYSVSSSYDYNDLSFSLSYNRRPEFLYGEGIGRSADDSWFSVSYYLNDNWNVGLDIRYFKVWKEYNTIDKPYYYEHFEHWTNDRHFRFFFNISYSFESGEEISEKRKKIKNKDSAAGLEL